MSYLLIHGDARRLPIDLGAVDAVVSDVPYGMNWNTDSTRFSGGDPAKNNRSPGDGRNDWGAIRNDDQPFDPSPWLACDRVILWGANHFAQRLPIGTTLVWIKKADHLFGTFLSDAEIGWMNSGHGVYCFRWQFPSSSRAFEASGKVAHPTQKPIALMRWCIQKLKLQPNSLILDPYMGSCSTGIAALQEGHRFIGIEIDRRYCDIARRRIERPHLPVQRSGRAEHHPLFRDEETTP